MRGIVIMFGEVVFYKPENNNSSKTQIDAVANFLLTHIENVTSDLSIQEMATLLKTFERTAESSDEQNNSAQQVSIPQVQESNNSNVDFTGTTTSFQNSLNYIPDYGTLNQFEIPDDSSFYLQHIYSDFDIRSTFYPNNPLASFPPGFNAFNFDRIRVESSPITDGIMPFYSVFIPIFESIDSSRTLSLPPLFTNNDDTINFHFVMNGTYIGNTNDALAGNDLVTFPTNAMNALTAGFDTAAPFQGGLGHDSLNNENSNLNLEIIGDLTTLTDLVAGDDIILGGTGNEEIYGDSLQLLGNSIGGNDIITGGNGNDILTGDALIKAPTATTGSDTFVFSNLVPQGSDIIKDFEVSKDILKITDVINLDGNMSIDYNDIEFPANNTVVDDGTDVTITYGTDGMMGFGFNVLIIEGIGNGTINSYQALDLNINLQVVG